MTIAFWCVLVAGLLPYVATAIAKSRPGFDNANPRAWLANLDGFRARAVAAQLNSFEAFPFFATAVIVAYVRGASQGTIDMLAMAFIAIRIVYLALYLANLATLRTFVWIAGVACVVTMFFVGG